jgi:FkbM family methyltransferase
MKQRLLRWLRSRGSGRQSDAGTLPIKTLTLGAHVFAIHGIAVDDPYFRSLRDDFEPDFSQICRRFVREDSICLDVGANIGIKTLSLSRHVSAGCVIAIEPAPTVVPVLRRNIELNRAHNVVIEATAIGDFSGTVKFADASAYGHVDVDHGGVEVPMMTLPELVKRLGLPRVDFLKIDVEGFEFPILRSCLDLITEHRTRVLFEFNSWCQVAYGDTNPRVFLEWVLANFAEVSLVRGRSGGPLLDPVGRGRQEMLRILHKNFVLDGCVNDVLALPRPRS